MNTLSSKIFLLAAVLSVGALMSGTAHAAILRDSNGIPVLTKDGACVITNWEGSDECDAAKTAAGLTDAAPLAAKAETSVNEVVYFDFNKAELTTEAKHSLDALAARLHPHWEGKEHHGHHHYHHHMHEENITIVGYADRLGKVAYNHKLALKRAEAVRAYLVGKGVTAKHIEVRSLGKTVPKADCSADLPHEKLVDCLREDRRVEIEYK